MSAEIPAAASLSSNCRELLAALFVQNRILMPAALIFSTAAADPRIGSVASQTTPSRSITHVPVFLSRAMGDMLAEREAKVRKAGPHGCENAHVRTLLVVYQSRSGGTQSLVDAAVEGAHLALAEMGTSPGVSLDVRHAFDTGPEDVKAAAAVLIATPANFGYMSGAVKDSRRVYHVCLEVTAGMPYAMIVKGDTDVDGAAAKCGADRNWYEIRARGVAETLCRRRCEGRACRCSNRAWCDSRGRPRGRNLLMKGKVLVVGQPLRNITVDLIRWRQSSMDSN